MKPLLELFADRDTDGAYRILNNYLQSTSAALSKRSSAPLLGKPVVFRAILGLFPTVAQRVADRYSADYSSANFTEITNPIFSNIPIKKLESPGTSWVQLKDYLEKRMRAKLVL